MTNGGEGNGHRRSGDLPERMRRLLKGGRGGAAAPSESAGVDAGLRDDLHAAIEQVMELEHGDLPPDQLERELHEAVHRVVEAHAQTPTPLAVPAEAAAGETALSRTAGQRVDGVMDRLDGVVQRTLGSARPGMERSRAYIATQLPRLVERLTVVLAEIAADEQRMLQVEAGLVRLLKARMSEKTARRVAKLALSAAKAAAWRKRRGSSGGT